jgi:hypothetical protein
MHGVTSIAGDAHLHRYLALAGRVREPYYFGQSAPAPACRVAIPVEELMNIAIDMTVRVLDKNGKEIAGFYDPEAIATKVPADLRKALAAFRANYPDSHYIDVEFAAKRE